MTEEQANWLIGHIRRIADSLEAIASILAAKTEVGTDDLTQSFYDLMASGFAPVWEEAEDDMEAMNRHGLIAAGSDK